MRCKGCKKRIPKIDGEYVFHLIFNGKNYHSFCIPNEPGIITSPSLERMMKEQEEEVEEANPTYDFDFKISAKDEYTSYKDDWTYSSDGETAKTKLPTTKLRYCPISDELIIEEEES